MHKANLVLLTCQAKKQQHFYDDYSLDLHNCSCLILKKTPNVTDKLWEANKINGLERAVIHRLTNINCIYVLFFSTLMSTCNLVRQPCYISHPKYVRYHNTRTKLSRIKIKSSVCLPQMSELGFVPAKVLSGGTEGWNLKQDIFSSRIRISVR